MHLNPTHSPHQSAGIKLHLIVNGQLPVPQRSRHYRPVSLHYKCTIDRQARHPSRLAPFHRLCTTQDGCNQLRQTRAAYRTHGHDGGSFKKAPRYQILHLHAHQRQPIVVHQVGLSQHDDPIAHSQQAANLKVLPRLRLNRLLGRHHQ